MAMTAVPGMQDRLLAAMRTAPIVEGSPEELAAFEEGLADIQAGRIVSAADVRAALEARAPK